MAAFPGHQYHRRLPVHQVRRADHGSPESRRRIINIASDAAKRASAMGAAYSASKFAVLGLTQASALDLAPYGITVNAVCPGPVNTDRLSYWERAQAEAQGIPLEEFRAKIVAEAGQRTPLGRIRRAGGCCRSSRFSWPGHRPGIQCERRLAVSLSHGDLLIAHDDSTHTPLRGNMFHGECDAIVRIQRLPVCVQQVFWTASTREE